MSELEKYKSLENEVLKEVSAERIEGAKIQIKAKYLELDEARKVLAKVQNEYNELLEQVI